MALIVIFFNGFDRGLLCFFFFCLFFDSRLWVNGGGGVKCMYFSGGLVVMVVLYCK